MTRVTLKDPRKTQVVELPSFEGSQVVVATELSVGGTRKIAEAKTDYDQLLAILSSCILSWNFDDETGNPVPVTAESLEILAKKDLDKLLEAITGKSSEELAKLGAAAMINSETAKKKE